jgi:hypothetical protein
MYSLLNCFTAFVRFLGQGRSAFNFQDAAGNFACRSPSLGLQCVLDNYCENSKSGFSGTRCLRPFLIQLRSTEPLEVRCQEKNATKPLLLLLKPLL